MTETDLQILQFATSKCFPPEDNRPAERPGINNLLEGIRTHGQLVPGLVCPFPDETDKFQLLDGVGRHFCCDKLNIPFRAMLLKAPVSEAERIKLRLQHNVLRRNMTAEEIADDAKRFMDIEGCTQEEAAIQLNLSPASLSRALTVHRRIPLELKDRAALLKPSTVALIAVLPTTDAMRQAFDYATTPKDGRVPTRDQVGVFTERFRKPRGTKVKKLGGVLDGRKVELGVMPGESTDSLIKFLLAMAKKLEEHRKVPAENLGFLFNGQSGEPVKA